VYDDVLKYAKKFIVCEFGGVEPNPHYETIMKALKVAKENKVNFVLAVGGGSVVDGAKFLIAAMDYTASDDPWDMITKWACAKDKDPKYAPHTTVKLGVVLTIPATGTETNNGGVITNVALKQKRAIAGPDLYPQFSVVDPVYTYSLPLRQVRNGITDAFVHVLEQYTAHFEMGRLQDRQAEAIMLTLMEIAQGNLIENPAYRDRADFVWCATKALDYHLAVGIVQCWGAHMIGHEMTTFYGLDHGQTLAITAPAILRKLLLKRAPKLAQLGRRVFGLTGDNNEEVAKKAIDKIEEFFNSIGQHTHLSQYKMDDSKFKDILASISVPFANGQITDKETVLEVLKLGL
jgi:NADP-dependent alcohol dehydrogenase